MTKRKKAKFHILKRIKHKFVNLWNDRKVTNLRVSYFIKKDKKTTFYSRLFDTKQIFKKFYLNVSETAFKSTLFKSVHSLSRTKDSLIKNFEVRLDCALYRCNFVESIQKARQLINHGLVFINGKKIIFCNKKLKNLDLIEVLKKPKIFTYFLQQQQLEYYLINKPRGLNIEIDYQTFRFIFIFDLIAKKVFKPIKIQTNLITRFYR